MAEEKKRLEAQLNQLDEDLEEERTQNELMQEKVKRANLQVITAFQKQLLLQFHGVFNSFLRPGPGLLPIGNYVSASSFLNVERI